MKALFLALVFASMLMRGSALKCVRCFPPDRDLCLPSPETCNEKNACVVYELKVERGRYSPPIKQCISMDNCLKLKKDPNYKVKCCQTDFCNMNS